MSFGPLCVAASADRLYVGGDFERVDGLPAMRVAAWDFSADSWATVGTGINENVYALALLDDDIYAAGLFTHAGGISANSVAKWNRGTRTWARIGSGTNTGGHVRRLAVFNEELFAGGSFQSMDGAPVNSIARYSPVSGTWSALSSNRANVSAFTELDGKLYVGGGFSAPDGSNPHNVAEWDPRTNAWSAIGTFDFAVYALAVLNGELYAGGDFLSPFCHIARWNPVTKQWSDVGGGVDCSYRYNGVRSLTVLHGRLYATGQFTSAGGIPVNHAAIWDPEAGSWSAWPGNPYRSAVTVINGALYAANSLGPGYQLARWGPLDQTWTPFGPRFDSSIGGVVRLDDHWYAGGAFTTVDGEVSAYFAEWVQGGSECPDNCDSVIWADADHDTDVDQDDFGVFQRCYTGNTQSIPIIPEYPCTCFDRNDSGGPNVIDEVDFAEFIKCISGPAVRWVACEL